jgi:hypothetical protein
MEPSTDTPSRDANGRFLPGQSGNPAGKQPGTRNRATLLREALRGDEDKRVARIVIDRALAGDAVAARFLLDRLSPRPRGRTIELDLPSGGRASDVAAAFDVTIRAMAEGEITPDEAATVARVLDAKIRALKARATERKSDRTTMQKPPAPLVGADRREAAPPANTLHPAVPAHLRMAGVMSGAPSCNGRGNDERFRARLLHSTYISPSATALGQAA